MRLGEVRDAAKEGSSMRRRRFADPDQGSSDVAEKLRKESTACSG